MKKYTITILKIIRIISILPIATMITLSIYNAFAGVNGFINTIFIGWEAFAWTMFCFLFGLWWVWLLSILGIVITTIILNKKMKTEKGMEE